MQSPAIEKILRQFIDPNIMCIRCRSGKKEPSEIKVTYHSCASSYILDWVLSGGNVGATSLTGYVVFIDGDSEEIRGVVENWINTLWWSTGKPGHKQYAILLWDEPLDSILRYIIVTDTYDYETSLKKVLREVLQIYLYGEFNLDDTIGLSVWSKNKADEYYVSLFELRLNNVLYSAIKEFEKALNNVPETRKLLKTFDSFKKELNREFFLSIYEIEMKIREIYSIAMEMIGIRPFESVVENSFKKNGGAQIKETDLMNELYFIEFSDYKNIDKRKPPGMKDLIRTISEVADLNDLANKTSRLSEENLHIENTFGILAKIPETVGRLEKIRNSIAHNRFISEEDISSFTKAKGDFEQIYNEFFARLKGPD